MRKLRQPIYGSGLILDVGSGGNPHPFADVLLEKYIDTTHRYKQITIDRPTVLADATSMPFKSGVFSYSFAFHVLEHLHQPEAFLTELERVSKAGYIETPNALYERIHPFDVHLLEIMLIDDTLHIRKKSGPIGDDFIGTLDLLEHDSIWRKFFGRHPRFFHVCYKWRGKIHFKLLNAADNTDWFQDPETLHEIQTSELSEVAEKSLRERLIHILRSLRRRTFDLDDLLACPACHSDLTLQQDHYVCCSQDCRLRFASSPVPDFNNPI
ncbi:methyltransferase domain-containing protein [Loktanella agnita]|uniref:methyltransferase domain-containing protein n=1 Tax=Loktanella agnita TaxID=287097 RepID=UPI003989439E